MKLRRLLTASPLLLLVKLVACADQSDPSDDPGATPGDGGLTDGPVIGNPDANPDGGPVGPPGTCETKKGKAGAGTVLKGTLLLPDDSAQPGEVFVGGDGLIVCAAKDCSSAPGYADATSVACQNTIITPGLINPHDHITFANVSPKPTTERFEHRHDWRRGLRNHKRISTSPVAGVVSGLAVKAAELRFMMTGATSTAGAGGGAGAKGLLRNVDDSTANLEGMILRQADSDTFPLSDSTPVPAFSQGTLTSCTQYAAGRRTAASIANLTSYLPHIAEGIDKEAHLEMTCQHNAEAEGSNDLFGRQTAVVHGIGVTAADVKRFRDDKVVLIWSPRSNVSLYGDTAPVTLYESLGVPVALGTDWLPSGSMNMQRELKCADELNQGSFGKKFSDAQIWRMVTINAAAAIGAADQLGQLKAGYWGDVAVFSTAHGKDHRAVIDGRPEDTMLVLRGGKPLYGDQAIMDALDGADCEPLDVCGTNKKACVKKDTGDSLADVRKNGEMVYPLFVCNGETPKDEPSCKPTRANYTGPKAGDKDGDGVDDAADNCPDVFNPVRPMDNGQQADADGDGKGDACDKCPLEAGEGCTPPSSADTDGDGIPDGADNCPEDANPDQADADKDGKGDVCDKCASPNPGATACLAEYTVVQLRNPADPGHPAAGGVVRAKISGVVVTAVKSAGGGDRGFFVQQPGAATFGGLFVKQATPTVQLGNVVTVEGNYDEIFGITTLSNPTVTVTAATGPAITPIVLSSAILGSTVDGEPTETMLVQVDGVVSVTKMNADANGDYDEFEVTGPMRVDDNLHDPLDNTYPVGTTFSKLVGINGFSFSNRKLWPRTAADFTTP